MSASPPAPQPSDPIDVPTVAVPPPTPLAKAETVDAIPGTRVPPLARPGDPTLDVWGPALDRDPDATPGHTLRTGSGAGPARSARLSRLIPRTRVDQAARSKAVEPGGPGAPASGADYTLLRELGRGGMGIVYEARQETLERPVALKMLHPDREGEAGYEERFANEARLTGRLEHPNIVAVYDLGRTCDHQLFLGMKLVRGSSFAALLRSEPPDTPDRLRRALEVLIAVSEAVAFAHSRRILHRDLKPDNVMVGEFGEVQVMDWGLAVDLDDPGEWVRAGTPAYMAPEQADGEPSALGTWSDVYLLGSMLYEILAGSPPHQGRLVLEVLRAAAKGDVEPPSVRAPGRTIPRDLETLTMAALARDPAKRIRTAVELRDGLRAHLAHAEALALVDRARALLEKPHASLDEKGESLARAELLLTQARELWAGSEVVRSLLARAIAAQVDLALDRGEGRVAAALAARLEPAGDVTKERVEQLRGAAARQRTAARNQTIAAVLVAFALVLTWVVLERVSQRRARQEAVRVARTELALRTRDAWQALTGERGGEAESEALASLARARADSGWASDETDEPLVAAHACWQALRRGEPRRAGQLLPEPGWRRALDAVWSAHEGKDPLAAAEVWREQARIASVPEPLARAAEACLVLSLARGLSSARLSERAPAIAERLDALGARAVLADARSGTPEVLLEGLEGAGAPRVRVLTTPPREAGPGAHEVPRVLVGLDAHDGRELWRFPPALAEALDAPVGSPLVLQGRAGTALRPTVAAAWGGSVLLLDLETGVATARLALLDHVAALLPADAGHAGAVQGASAGRARSRGVPFGPEGFQAPLVPASLNRMFEAVSATSWLGSIRRGGPPTADVWSARLERIAAARRLDPGNPYWDYEEAEALDRLTRFDEAGAALDRFAARPGLAPVALAAAGAWATRHPRLQARAIPLLERAAREDAALGHDPEASPGVVGNAATLARSAATVAAEQGDAALMLRELALSRELATVLEGDRALLALERRWLEEHGRAGEVPALAPFEERARVWGDALLVPDGLVEAAIPALVIFLVAPLVLGGAALVLWARTNASRMSDLRSLGFRSTRARVLAFLTNPLLRLSHTFLAYASRAERVLFVGGAVLAILSGAQLSLVLSTSAEVGGLPSEVVTGHLGHPTVTETALLAAERDPRDPRPLRVLAAGALQRGDAKRAHELHGAILALAPDDPFALASEGVLLEREGRPDAALALYEKAGRGEGEAGAPGRWNAARLHGVAPAARPALPVGYASRQRLEDAAGRPLAPLAQGDDLRGVLETSSLPTRFARLALAWMFGRGSNLLVFGDLGAPVEPLEESLRVALRVLLFWALVHVPFRRRALAVPPAPGRLRHAVAQVLDLAWPGVRRLVRGELLPGALALLVAPLLLVLAWEGTTGGILSTLSIFPPSLPLAQTLSPDASPLALQAPLARDLGRFAVVGLALLYGATWLSAALRAVRWWRSSRAA